MKARILHLSADYPDGFEQAKTNAIRGLVEGTREQFEHRVVSLNRRGGFTGWLRLGKVLSRAKSGDVLAYRYGAPPAAVAIEPIMRRVATTIAEDLRETGFQPDLVQGHKLTVEGFLARHVAAQLGVPFVLTLQGNTDQKLLLQRPDRLAAIRAVWCEAKAIMAFAPWTGNWCSQRLGTPARPVVTIPCLLPHDDILPPRNTSPLIRTAFNLDFWRNKNIETVLTAVRHIIADGTDVRLEIGGDGSDAAREAIERLIAKAGLTERASLVGPIAPSRIQEWFNSAAMFVLPSHRESFGMVFAEALLAGTPVVYSRGTAIDGYFPGAAFARSVPANQAAELAAAMVDLLKGNTTAKAALAKAQAEGGLTQFQRPAVLANYVQFLEGALT